MLQKTKVWKTLERGSKKEERGREREGERDCVEKDI